MDIFTDLYHFVFDFDVNDFGAIDACRLLRYTAKWSQPFTDYFISTVHSRIDKLRGWELHARGLDSATTNQSEGFNTVLKRLNDWKEAPVDIMALSLFRLATDHVTEIKYVILYIFNSTVIYRPTFIRHEDR